MQDDKGITRVVFFADTFDHAPAPSADPDNNGDETSTVTPEFATIWLDKSALDHVEVELVVLYLKSFQHKEGFYYWVP
jgi:hypothetical protein